METNSVQIVRLTAGELPQVTRLFHTQLQEHHVAISEDRIRGSLENLQNHPERGFCLVLKGAGQTLGAAYVSFVWALEHGGLSAWLEELYVSPEHRCGGYGTLLLKRIIAECIAAGCAAIDLEIDADHERVRTLYQRADFRPLPRSRMFLPLSTSSDT